MTNPTHYSQWKNEDTVRYIGEENFTHASLTVGKEYQIWESPNEFESFVVLDDDGDELGVLVGEFEFVSQAS